MCVGLFASVKGCFLLVLFFYFPSLVVLHSINLSCWLFSAGSLFLPLLWLHLEGLFGHHALRNCHMNSSTIQLSNAFMARIFGRLISISSAVLVVCVRNEEKEQIQLVWQLQSASRQTAIGRQQTISCWAKTCGWQRLDGVGVFASVKSVWQLLERERLTECRHWLWSGGFNSLILSLHLPIGDCLWRLQGQESEECAWKRMRCVLKQSSLSLILISDHILFDAVDPFPWFIHHLFCLLFSLAFWRILLLIYESVCGTVSVERLALSSAVPRMAVTAIAI